MLFPIKQLIEGRGAPLCVSKSTPVREALSLMVINDYSQLPVINDQGNLIGLISETSIINTYYQIDAEVSLLGITVDHCMSPAKTISPDSDIFEALNLLENRYAVVVVEGQKPVGILTDFDTTHFFRDLSEGLIIVEDIEVTLRKYIERVFPSDHSMDAALMRAFKESKRDPSRPAKEFEGLSFSEHIHLITTKENWKKFEAYFAPKEIFVKFMEQVGKIRNQLAHFRGRLEPIQLNALIRARDWLSTRPQFVSPTNEQLELAEIKPSDLTGTTAREGKYDPLQNWLALQAEQGKKSLQMDFSQIESLLGWKLPDAARNHPSWWSNDPDTHSQALSWMAAGWLVDNPNLGDGVVSFRQTTTALYYPFFSDLMARLKSARPGITQASKITTFNYVPVYTGVNGFIYYWTLPKEHVLRVDIYIDKLEKGATKAAFYGLERQKAEIEAEIGETLTWQPILEARASRIFAARPFHITDPTPEHEPAKQWGLAMMIKFLDSITPRLRELK